MASSHTFCTGKVLRSAPCSASSAASSVRSLVEKGQNLNPDIVVNLRAALGVLEAFASTEVQSSHDAISSAKKKRKKSDGNEGDKKIIKKKAMKEGEKKVSSDGKPKKKPKKK